MLERGFIEVKTIKDIITGKGNQPILTVSPNQTVAEAFGLMKKYDIENLPVVKDGEPIGSVSESGLFGKIFESPDIKSTALQTVMEPAYPLVSIETPVEHLGKLINKDNGAILSRDESGDLHIVTKYDIIQSLTKP